MPLDEIEVPGSSISFTCMTLKVESLEALYGAVREEGESFSVDPERPGFLNLDFDGRLIRGYYSLVVPFEVEHLTEGITTKILLKRIESCEFFALDGILFATGKTTAQKNLARGLTPLAGFGVTNIEHDFHQMSQFHDRLSDVKAIVLTNPKDRDIRRARLAGRIESYTEYNIVDPRNHGIESVQGIVDSPLGPITVTVGRKGTLRLGVKKGFVMTIDCMLWLMALIRDEKPPQLASPSGGKKTPHSD
ncbi:MAG: hypothetical protein HQM09_11795 [Candidatus Riflebacteria bacterium]|nr:hypothetical protein [Candidatus Riflebacteria bacterium]